MERELGLHSDEPRRIRAHGQGNEADPEAGASIAGRSKGPDGGFALALPNVNHALKKAEGKLLPTGLLKILYYQRLIKDVRVIALGVTEEYRTTGVAAGFYATLVRNALKLGYDGECEMSWILEDNTLMNRSAELMGVKRYKTYRIYEWN